MLACPIKPCVRPGGWFCGWILLVFRVATIILCFVTLVLPIVMRVFVVVIVIFVFVGVIFPFAIVVFSIVRRIFVFYSNYCTDKLNNKVEV